MLAEDTHGLAPWIQSFIAGAIPGSEHRNSLLLFKRRCRAWSGFCAWLWLFPHVLRPQREIVGSLWPQAWPPGLNFSTVENGRRLPQQLSHRLRPALRLGRVCLSGRGSLCRQVLPGRSTHLLSQARGFDEMERELGWKKDSGQSEFLHSFYLTV